MGAAWSAHADLRATAMSAIQEAIRVVPYLLDLKIDITIMVPEEWAQDVVNALQSQSDIVCSMPSNNGYCIIICRMPLKYTFGYADRLKSISQGTGSFTMRLAKNPEM